MNTVKSSPNEPKGPRPGSEESSVIDTSKMSAEQRAALELTEAARDATTGRGFIGGLFMGEFDASMIHPFPIQAAEDRDQGDAFLQRLESFLREHVDPDEIDRTGEIPDEVIRRQHHHDAVRIPLRNLGGGEPDARGRVAADRFSDHVLRGKLR